MAKQSGIGGLFLFNGFDLSGDVGVMNSIRDSQNLLDVTGLDKGAPERIPGLADGGMDFTAFFNDAATVGAHQVLKNFGSGDKLVTYAVDTAIGSGGWSMTGKQADYAGVRGADGSLAFTVQVTESDGNGLWGGDMLTAGKRTDTAATEGATVDGLLATALGAELFLQVVSFAGTDATVLIEDSANNIAWLPLSGGSFTAITTGPTSQHISLGATAAVRRYLRATTTTSGGFTSLVYSVMVCRR